MGIGELTTPRRQTDVGTGRSKMMTSALERADVQAGSDFFRTPVAARGGRDRG